MEKELKEGDAIATKAGRIGMVVSVDERGVIVTFGPDGPTRLFRPGTLVLATADYITAAGLDGVNFNECGTAGPLDRAPEQ